MVAAWSGDSIGGMPVDAKLQAILDAGKALGGKPVEVQTPEEARAERAQMMARFVPMPEYAGVHVEERMIDAEGRKIPVRIYTPPSGDGPFPVVVYFHGGGWVACTLETHDPICRALTLEAKTMVVSVDYRLAPEHKFPAGLEDCRIATKWVLAHAEELGGNAEQVLVGGDSAGGTMATVVALLFRDEGVTGLAGQILIYPVTAYYDPPSTSYLENAEGYGLTRKGMMWFWDHYLNNTSEGNDFRAAPMRAASLAELPRAFVVTAEYDVLRDEGQAYAKRLAEAGVDVTHVFVEGMNHGFMSSGSEFPFLPQGKEVLRKIAAWLANGR
jgi:acetyl esterase